MSMTFTPSAKVSASSNPRDWAYELACLPQSASIVFTKETFLAFLKTHNIDISPNYTEINKLPRYAQIGTMSAVVLPGASEAVDDVTEKVATLQSSNPVEPPTTIATAPLPPPPEQKFAKKTAAAVSSAEPAVRQDAQQYAHDQVRMHNADVITPDGNEFRPTRRVREPIGGGSALISALFGDPAEDEESLAEATRENARRRGLLQESNAQPQEQRSSAAPPTKQALQQATQAASDQSENVFRPTRRVREPGGTGGSSSIALG